MKNNTHLTKGRDRFFRGEVDLALQDFRRAVRENPRSPEARHRLGAAYYVKGRATDAVRHLRRAIELGPEGGPFTERAWKLLRNVRDRESA